MTGSQREGPGFGRVRRTLRRIRLQRGGAATPILIRKASTTPEAALAMRGLLVLSLAPFTLRPRRTIACHHRKLLTCRSSTAIDWFSVYTCSC
jgi:hypothetical protein